MEKNKNLKKGLKNVRIAVILELISDLLLIATVCLYSSSVSIVVTSAIAIAFFVIAIISLILLLKRTKFVKK